ncbi:3-dehydroquinate dehydratase type I [Dillenia turbinata]|uniref:3-dehydroquinate dehydratase type I n=1 Tax=Dillenia turbinata TaxID=194707 RepID=A0AAN8VB08_9MAGN
MADSVDQMINETIKAKRGGGLCDDEEKKRLDVLRLAMESGADYVDVEHQVADEFSNSIYGKQPENFIVSSHNYQNTPSIEDLGKLLARIQATGAERVKIATTALHVTDVACMFQITVHSQVNRVCGLTLVDFRMLKLMLRRSYKGVH